MCIGDQATRSLYNEQSHSKSCRCRRFAKLALLLAFGLCVALKRAPSPDLGRLHGARALTTPTIHNQTLGTLCLRLFQRLRTCCHGVALYLHLSGGSAPTAR